MKVRRYLLVGLVALLSMTMMACPKVENMPPEFVYLVDGEVESLIDISYEHEQWTVFDPEVMLQSLISAGKVLAIDYKQSGVIIGNNREYEDISSDILFPTFYARWYDGDDANFDGVVNLLDEDFYGQYKTDEDGNYVYDQDIIDIIGFSPEGQEIAFTLRVVDADGAFTQLSGVIVIVKTN